MTPAGDDDSGERIDFDQVRDLARRERPRLIVAGTTAYTRIIDPQPFRQIADEVGALLMFDAAHPAGLIAGGAHPSPVGVADVVTFTTHKTLRGPRGGAILAQGRACAKPIDAAVFPGLQGGPLDHVVAAKAVAFAEAMTPDFKQYAANVVENAAALADALRAEGFRLVGGGTENHQVILDLRTFDEDLTGPRRSGGARPRRDHLQPQPDPRRPAFALHHERPSTRVRGGDDGRDGRDGDGDDRRTDGPGAAGAGGRQASAKRGARRGSSALFGVRPVSGGLTDPSGPVGASRGSLRRLPLRLPHRGLRVVSVDLSGPRGSPLRTGAVDRPGELRIHDRPLPVIGGAGMCAAFVVAIVVSGRLPEAHDQIFQGLVRAGRASCSPVSSFTSSA